MFYTLVKIWPILAKNVVLTTKLTPTPGIGSFLVFTAKASGSKWKFFFYKKLLSGTY